MQKFNKNFEILQTKLNKSFKKFEISSLNLGGKNDRI